MKKRSLFLLISILFININYSQGWLKKAGGSSDDGGESIAIDGSGNSFVTGWFEGSATFGLGEANVTTLNSSGNYDIFITKYDPSGNLIWAKKAGGAGNENGYGIATDPSDNVIITGNFNGSPTFGLGEANATTLNTSGTNDVFIAKYDPSGNLLWAKQAGGTQFEYGRAVATDGSGNSAITGRFNGTAVFGAGEPNATTLIGSEDIYLAKYDPSGNLLWAKQAGGPSTDYGKGVASDGSGNWLVSGMFDDYYHLLDPALYDPVTFGVGESTPTVVTGQGWRDIFIAKYSTDGILSWVKIAGGTNLDEGMGIATDGSGNCIVTGTFAETATFGVGEATPTDITVVGGYDIFVAKYNTNGILLWVKQAGGTTWGDWGIDVATNDSGDALVIGYFEGSATFGIGESLPTVLTSAGGSDIFITKYNSGGTFQWAKRAGGSSDDRGHGIVAGSTIITGQFAGTATFDPGGTFEQSLSSAGQNDMFIAHLFSDGSLPVELSSFTVESTLEGVLFKWTTESETENLGFILERRIAGTDWIEIASYKTDEGLLGQGSTPSATEYEYLDVFVEPATIYEYRLADVDYNGIVTYHAIRKVTVKQTPLTKVIKEFTVLPAYPNPFNPSTTLRYGLDSGSHVTINIYDITGQLITTLKNTYQLQDWHSVVWNGTNKRGEQVPAGLYLSRIISDNKVKTTKLMLLK